MDFSYVCKPSSDPVEFSLDQDFSYTFKPDSDAGDFSYTCKPPKTDSPPRLDADDDDDDPSSNANWPFSSGGGGASKKAGSRLATGSKPAIPIHRPGSMSINLKPKGTAPQQLSDVFDIA